MNPTPPRRIGWLGPIRAFMILTLVLDLLFLPLTLLHIQGITIADAPLDAVADIRNYPLHPKFPDVSLDHVAVTPGRNPTYPQYLLYEIEEGLAYVLATIPMLFYAIRITGEAMRGDPFTLRMVRRLRNLGLLVLIGGLLSEVASSLAGDALIDVSLPHDDLLRGTAISLYRPDFWWLLPAFILFAVAAIVKRGVDLRTELDGVI